jgi:hypothetical protein
MVSDVFAGGEGWKLIDQVPGKNVCHHFPKSEYPHGKINILKNMYFLA